MLILLIIWLLLAGPLCMLVSERIILKQQFLALPLFWVVYTIVLSILMTRSGSNPSEHPSRFILPLLISITLCIPMALWLRRKYK